MNNDIFNKELIFFNSNDSKSNYYVILVIIILIILTYIIVTPYNEKLKTVCSVNNKKIICNIKQNDIIKIMRVKQKVYYIEAIKETIKDDNYYEVIVFRINKTTSIDFEPIEVEFNLGTTSFYKYLINKMKGWYT